MIYDQILKSFAMRHAVVANKLPLQMNSFILKLGVAKPRKSQIVV